MGGENSFLSEEVEVCEGRMRLLTKAETTTSSKKRSDPRTVLRVTDECSSGAAQDKPLRPTAVIRTTWGTGYSNVSSPLPFSSRINWACRSSLAVHMDPSGMVLIAST